MRAEYGPPGAFRLPDVKAYDSSGNEIKIPLCDSCGSHKCQVIGKECSAWICTICDGHGNKMPEFKLLYKDPSTLS